MIAADIAWRVFVDKVANNKTLTVFQNYDRQAAYIYSVESQ
jgi:hypothetical protein